MKEHSWCRRAVGVPSGQERYTLASGIPSSSKSRAHTHPIQTVRGINKRYLKESHTPDFLALRMFSLYLLQLIRNISALPSEELQWLSGSLEVSLGNEEDWRPWHPEHPEPKKCREDDTDSREKSPLSFAIQVNEKDAQEDHQLHTWAQSPPIPSNNDREIKHAEGLIWLHPPFL